MKLQNINATLKRHFRSLYRSLTFGYWLPNTHRSYHNQIINDDDKMCPYVVIESEEDTWSLSDFDEDGDGILKSKQTDDLSIQWKRRTILTVEASFPHLKRRLEVVSTKEIDFSPIERAIDEIKSKNRQLATHLAVGRQSAGGEGGKGGSGAAGNGGHAGNISLLMDMHLTGALLPQVNQGPMAYARVFLQREAQDGFPSDMVKTLKIQFMQFLTLCHLLLRAYYELMSHVHEPKYQAMRAALDRYRLELSNLLKEEVVVDEDHSVLASAGLCEAVRRDLARRLVLGDPSQAR